MTGFTNVVWEARPAKQLATDLYAGAGDGPLIAAALGWTQVSALLADAGVDYVRILARLGISWESVAGDAAFGKLASFADWFSDAAASAADSAARAGAQAAATTVARISMPGLPEMQITEDIHAAAVAVGAATGAPIGGVAADAERAALDQKQRAARVMESYEAATEPVARGWTPPRPAEIVSPDALAAEQAVRQAARAVPAHSEPTAGAAPGGGIGGYAPVSGAPRQTRFATTILAGSTASTGPVQPVPQSAGARPAVPAAPMAPLVGAPGQGGDSVARRSPANAGAGIDPAGAPASGVESLEDVAVAAAVVLGDHPDPRYRSGTLDLPHATSVPAVLGAMEHER